MAQSPMVILIIVVCSLTFQAVVFGDELVKRSFPELDQPSSEACDAAFLEEFICGFREILSYIVNFFKVLFGVIVFLINLISFNVPGAPGFVRVIVGSIMSGGLLWSVATLFRGN